MKESCWDQAKDRLYIFKKKKKKTLTLPASLYTHTVWCSYFSLPTTGAERQLGKQKKQWMRELIDFEINNTQLHRLLCE